MVVVLLTAGGDTGAPRPIPLDAAARVFASDFTRFVVAMPSESNGWTLELDPKWETRPGSRAGSRTVAPRRVE